MRNAACSVILTCVAISNAVEGQPAELGGPFQFAWLFIGPVSVTFHFLAKARYAPNNSYMGASAMRRSTQALSRQKNMRLWSLHPKYFDPQGLVALWRESLLAQAVLRGETRGYRNHPQLDRFKIHPSPLVAMSVYLSGIYAEAEARGYKFDASKIRPARTRIVLSVTSGQLEYEWKHLMAKLRERNPELYRKWQQTEEPETHPLFRVCAGEIENWERPLG